MKQARPGSEARRQGPLSEDRPDMAQARAPEFERSATLEEVLKQINEPLADRGGPWMERPVRPVVLIVGAPRSGTTLLMQWLAATGQFGYPSNLVARFYGHPGFGVRVQQALHDYDEDNQIGLRGPLDGAFESRLGRTLGALAPSEFWYWWRRFFVFPDVQVLPRDAFEAADTARFLHELAEMEQAFGRPLLMKGMHLNWHLSELAGLSERFFFLHLRRDDRFVAQSIYRSRERFFGTSQRWWSHKPPEFERLRKLAPEEQVAGQAVFTDAAVARGLQAVPEARRLAVRYSDFCAGPGAVYAALADRLAAMSESRLADYQGPERFEPRDGRRLDKERFAAINQACRRFRSELGRDE